jgi:hypothetical protein
MSEKNRLPRGLNKAFGGSMVSEADDTSNKVS